MNNDRVYYSHEAEIQAKRETIALTMLVYAIVAWLVEVESFALSTESFCNTTFSE